MHHVKSRVLVSLTSFGLGCFLSHRTKVHQMVQIETALSAALGEVV